MYRHHGAPRQPLAKRAAILAGVLSLAVAMIALSGCSAPPASGSAASTTPATQVSSTATKSMSGMMGSGNSTATKCGDCSDAARPETATVSATIDGDVQVVTIRLENGYYRPNAITAKAGIPIQVRFEGTAMGCVAHPTFKSLNKKADMTKGSTTLDLGSLKAGKYDFSCAMDVNPGTLTVY